MPQIQNRRFVLASRPDGEPREEHFRLETTPVPAPADGEVLIRHLYLSLDPYMRGRMSDRASYARPVGIGEMMVGGTVGKVVESRSSTFRPGDIVSGYGGWQDYSIGNAEAVGPNQLFAVPHGADDPPISTALGAAGMPGCTAYFGVSKLADPKPGETLVVSAASGAVGSVVGQIAKMRGCRVVGIAGGRAKCRYCVEELGFDECVDYKAETDLNRALGRACPRGVDMYFENVGGHITEAVAPLLNAGSRAPICGIISQYNEENPVWPGDIFDRAPNRPTYRFFLVWEWPEEYPAALDQLRQWIRQGKLKYREDIVDGLEHAPAAFQRLFRGENFGKLLVKIAEDD